MLSADLHNLYANPLRETQLFWSTKIHTVAQDGQSLLQLEQLIRQDSTVTGQTLGGMWMIYYYQMDPPFCSQGPPPY